MPSEIVTMLVPEDCLSAAMLVRRTDGAFVFKSIDARVAAASRLAAPYQTATNAPVRVRYTGGKPS
jgi:hypothetical protein